MALGGMLEVSGRETPDAQIKRENQQQEGQRDNRKDKTVNDQAQEPEGAPE